MRTFVFASLLLISGNSAATAAAPSERTLVDRVVAVVNDEVITMSELETAAKPFLEHNEGADKKKALMVDMLDQLIGNRLLDQQVREAKIEVTDDEVKRAIQDILKQNKITEDNLTEIVRSRGMSMGQYKEDLKQQLIRLKLVDMKVRSRVVIPESEIKGEYEKEARLEKREQLVTVRHLFFRYGESPDASEKPRQIQRAKAARARILKGEDFAAVAKETSEGPTAKEGGLLGEVSMSGLLPELARVVPTLKDNEVSGVIETQNGAHVIRIEQRRKAEPASFADRRASIYQRLYQAEVDRQMKVWIDELRAQGAVTVRL